jgi:hypothetical protein
MPFLDYRAVDDRLTDEIIVMAGPFRSPQMGGAGR